MQNFKQNANKLRMLQLSTSAIASVVIVEVSVGLLVNSLAIQSDGIHALLDTITGIGLFFATRAALRPPDEEHTYGHEKYEPIGGLAGGIALVGVALLIIYEAITRIAVGVGVNTNLELGGFFAIGYTFSVDIFRLAIFRKASGSQSATVKAGLYDAIADFGSTVIALLGFGLATLFKFYQGDAVASVALGVFLCYLSFRLVKSSVAELSDTATKGQVQQIRKEILACDEAIKCENLKTRKVGSKTFVEATVQVANYMSLEEAHALASRIEENLKRTFGDVEATIHIEPSNKEIEIKQLVSKLAATEGVEEIHEISTAYVNSRLYITLHAYVDPKLSVEEAHVLAEKIESNMYSGIRQLENVTVHLEPQGSESHSTEIDQKELRRIIENVAQNVERNLRIHRILTYKTGGKLYVNIDCGFAKQISVAEAHKIASRIEKEIKAHFENAVVTVHAEPESA